jgi:ABC-2 type transport system ATP-binding protein
LTAAAVEFAGVGKSYGATRALDDVTFSVARGEMFGIIGPDGAGKTTAIRLACGLLRPTAGTVRVVGHDPVREHRRITGAVGYLSQRFSLYGDLTIDENIAFFAELHGVRRFETARDQLLHMTQLTRFRARRADRLSGGMKQKLALACTLVHEPDLLVLDEPTTGVDPVARREFWKLLSEFLARGLTIVMSTPYLDEAERCGRVVLLHEGRVLAVDRPAALQAALGGRIYEVVVEAPRPPVELLASVAGVVDVQSFGQRAHVRVAEAPNDPERAIASTLQREGIGVVSIRAVAATLEDVFIASLAGTRDAVLGTRRSVLGIREDTKGAPDN